MADPGPEWIHVNNDLQETPETSELRSPVRVNDAAFPRRDLREMVSELFEREGACFVPVAPDDAEEEQCVRSGIVRRIVEMTTEPGFSLTASQRLEVLKHVMLAFKPTIVPNSVKVGLVSGIMACFGEFLEGDVRASYSDWCTQLPVLVPFLLDLNPDMFSAGKLQRFWWALRSSDSRVATE